MSEVAEQKAVEDRVIGAIKSGEVKMRASWYFWLQRSLIVASVLVLLLSVLYLVSFIIFILHETGAWFGIYLGVSGWAVFFHAVPWSLILVSLALILILDILLSRYPFIYKYPLLYSLLGLIVIVGLGGSLLAATSFHARLFRSLGGFYSYYDGAAAIQAHRGEVTGFLESGLVLSNFDGTTSTVIFDAAILPSIQGAFTKGDLIVVFGPESATHTIQAFGVEKIVP